MSNFSLAAFQEAFAPCFSLKMAEVAGRPRALGGARGVGVDLLLASHNADHVQSAAMQLAFADGELEFDAFSQDCFQSFVAVVLGNTEAAASWTRNAFRQVGAEGVTSCSTTHDGFVLTLRQQKPYQMFLLTASDEDSSD
jgi:hypothetical protein